MNVYAIIVTYNGKQWYDKCLGSLRDSSQAVLPIVVDNASTDGSVEYIHNNYPEVNVIQNSENLGFAKANNIGIRYALNKDADYVFLLNQDAWVEKNTIDELLHTFENNNRVGIATPIHLNGNCSSLDQGFAVYAGKKFTSDAYMRTLKPYYELAFVNAAAWMISSECIRTVGGFDTSLFRHYGEDDNYIQRLKYHGFKLVLNTKCTICHDREHRNIEEENENNAKLNPNLERSENLGNICKNIDVSSMISKVKVKRIKAMLKLDFKRANQLLEDTLYLQKVKKSREMNIRGGEVWL